MIFFLLFCIFLETRFLRIKNQFSPLFSPISSPIWLKIFLVRLQVIWGAYFFVFFYNFFHWSLAGFAKFLGSKKPRDFANCSVFSFSSLKNLEFLKKKKNTHPDWVRLPTVKISGQTDEIYGITGGKTFCNFWTLGSLELQEDDVWQLCVHDNFCSTTRGLSTLKVSGIFVRPFLRNAGKGGGPLKGTPPPFLSQKNFFFDFCFISCKGVPRSSLHVL